MMQMVVEMAVVAAAALLVGRALGRHRAAQEVLDSAPVQRVRQVCAASSDSDHVPLIYRTRDGEEDYHFSFERQRGGRLRIYITRQPSYGSRATDAHSTHRYSDGSRRYICWTGELRDLDDAKKVAAMWADRTQRYIRTGKGF